MSFAGALLALTLLLPLGMVAACALPAFRARVFDLLPLAALPGLLAALGAPGGSLVVAPAPLRLVLELDATGAMLLGGAALLWTAAGLYARAYMRDAPGRTGFAVWWLLTLAGSLGTFLVADMTSFYLVFSLVSLSAYGLVVQEGTLRANRAGVVYMALALLGEAFLLLGFVMLATAGPEGNPLIREAVAALPGSPWRDATLALLVLGFGLKMGLVPLHVWMPLAHPVAPMPASAVLSGIVVKAGVIGLIRFLPFDAGMAGWGTALLALGFFTAFYGVAVGITQHHPKTVLAYSTVSQMGVVAAVLGAGLAAGDAAVPLVGAYYALHHMLVKGALFLGIGVSGATGIARRWIVNAVMAVMALSLAGLPFTSGALAKLASKAALGDGAAGTLAILSAIGSALLMLHFLRRLEAAAKAAPGEAPPAGIVVPWLAIAGASILIPWMLFAPVSGYAPASAVEPAKLWDGVWPILVGGLLALALKRWGDRLPGIPEGDVVVLAERATPAVQRLATAIERAEAALRQWPVAGIALLAVALALGAALQVAP